MKPINVILKSIILVCLPLTLSAQYNDMIKHWSFESGNKDHLSIVTNPSELSYTTGSKGKGLLMNEQGGYINIDESEELLKEFTFSFWFKPMNISKRQTIFYHFRQVKGDYFVRNFLRLDINKGTFRFKSELKEFDLDNIRLEEDKWYFLNYVFDGKETKLYLQGKEVYNTPDKISIYDKFSYRMQNRLFIGRSHLASTQFKGVVDEIMIFNKGIDTKVASKIFKDNPLSQVAGIKVEEPIKEVREIGKPKEKEVKPIVEANPNTPPKLVVVEDYKVLEPLVVRTTGIVVELTAEREYDKDAKLMVALNDAFIDVPFSLGKSKKKIKIALNLGKENSFTFEAFQLNDAQNCKVKAKILSNNKVVGTYTMNLKQNNVVLPIAYLRTKDKKPRNYKSITVNETFITIKVKDNSKVDGDVITIRQDGVTLLENYTLTAELKEVAIELKPNQINEFTFVPVSMGKSSGENTALVIILVNDQIIHDFSLRSIDINRPAKLAITHESF